jgi:thioredoxin 1
MKAVTTREFNELRGSGKALVVDFYADWCGPCRAIAPEVEALATSVGDAATFVKIDTDANIELARELGILSIPTVIHFGPDGAEVARSTGLRRSAMLADALGLTVNAA